MSYEGYTQFLCRKGHSFDKDVSQWEEDPKVCPKCRSKIIWMNMVDITNGSYNDKGKRIDGYVRLKVKSKKVCSKCCSVLEVIYHIPKKDGVMLGGKNG